MTRVLVLTDQPILGRGFQETLSASGFEVISLGDPAAQSVEAFASEEPELVLLDLTGEFTFETLADAHARMPGPLGLASAQASAWLMARWQAWQDFKHAREHASLLILHAHHHNDFERHHHGPGDDMVALGTQAATSAMAMELGAAAAVGAATLPRCLSACRCC